MYLPFRHRSYFRRAEQPMLGALPFVRLARSETNSDCRPILL
jgi:hypothetical protein